MKWLLLVLLVSGCPASPPTKRPSEPAALAPASATTDAIPTDANVIAEISTSTWKVEVFDGGMVRWTGDAAVQSIGVRHGRLSPETLRALTQMFDDAKFSTMEAPAWTNDCPKEPTAIGYWPPDGEGNHLEHQHCPEVPEIGALETRFRELVGVEQWIAGNPPAPGGPLPDGDHFLLRYRRTMCFGECPAYTLTVFDDGTLVWNGEHHTALAGEDRFTVTPETIATLQSTVEAARFWEIGADGTIPQPCPPGEVCAIAHTTCTDTSHSITTYQRNGDHRTIDDAHCWGETPLTRLEDEIEWLLIGDQPWIAEPKPVLTLERTNCKEGTCRAFSVTLHDNGRLVWNGTSGVAAVGERRAWLRWSEMSSFIDAFEKAGFLTMEIKDAEMEECTVSKGKKGKRTCRATPPCADDGFGHVIVTYAAWNGETRTVDQKDCRVDRPLQALVDAIELEPHIGEWR